MRSGRLFWRLFSAIMLATLFSVLIFTGVIATTQSHARQENYENEVRLQAREIAVYMSNLNELSKVRDNITLRQILTRKLEDIYIRYNADIWFVSFNSGVIQVLDRNWNTAEGLSSEAMLKQLAIIKSGKEIRVTGLFGDLGDSMVTIGVPWSFSNGEVVGAVLVHIARTSLQVPVFHLIPQIAPAALLTLMLGTFLSILLAKGQTRPLKEIDSAVREFSKGEFTRRISLHCGGELETLGNSINKMADELSRLENSRRHFVASASHELRSPMTCMRGYVQAMLDGTIPAEEFPRYLQIVLDETNRLTALVNDLLEISRFESGKFPLEIAAFDANEMIRRTLITFEPRIESQKVAVVVNFGADRCWALGDVRRINQVVSNFVDNALKFMPEKDGILTISTRQIDQNILFSIQDNGAGISSEDLPHIFERFYKADKAHTSGMGTGLGLSICNLIIRQHNSEINVRSRPGATVFEFLLPAADPPQPIMLGESAEDSAQT